MQHRQRKLRDRSAVHQKRTLLTVVHPQQQIRQTGLSAAGPPQNSQHLPRLHMQIHRLQHRLLPVGVGEGQIFQGEFPPDLHILPLRNAFPVHNVRFLPENAGYPLESRRSLAEHIDTVPAGDHGPHQHTDIGGKSHKLTHRDCSRQNHLSAEDQCQQKTDAGDGIQGRPKHRPQFHHRQILLLHILTGPGKGLKVLFLLDKSLQHTHPRQAFLNLVRQAGESLLASGLAFFCLDAVEIAPHRHQSQGHKCQNGQLQIHIDHHLEKHHHRHHHRVKDSHHRRPHRHPDRLKIVGEMGHQIPCFMAVEIPRGQGFQM